MKIFTFCSFIILLAWSTSIEAQVIDEGFDTGIPTTWSQYTEAGFDFVSWFDGEVNLFKQSDGDESLMLISPYWDMTNFTKLEFDLYGFNLSFSSTTVPELHLGYLTEEDDPSSFRSIHTFYVGNTAQQTFEYHLGAINGSGNLVFKLEGDPSHIIYLDNVRIYEDEFEDNVPTTVGNLSLSSVISETPLISASWTNPSLEADGDPLSDLSTVDFFSDNTEVYSLTAPTIGGEVDQEIELPAAGYYTFQVSATNDAGRGYVLFTDQVWAGLDLPDVVTDLAITKDGSRAILDWTAPVVGQNAAYFDGVIDSYQITRSDGKVILVPGNESSHTDDLDIQGSINYTVQAINSSGFGVGVASEIIYHIEDEFLYYEDFYLDIVESPNDQLDYSHKWTSTSTSASFWNHFNSNFAGGDAGEMAFLWSGGSTGNDITRAISPIIDTEGLDVVTLEFSYSADFPNAPDFEFTIETTSDGGATWNLIDSFSDNVSVQEEIKKIIGNDDVGSANFQFAIGVKGNTAYGNFGRFDNFRLYFQPGLDLRILGSNTPLQVEPGTEINLEMIIENLSTEIADATVFCSINRRYANETIVDRQKAANGLEVGEVSTVDFGTWRAEEGEYILGFEIRNQDDQVIENNFLELSLDVYQLMDRELVMVEDFTGTWCAFCPGAALGIEDLRDEGYDIAVVAWHRSDDYETPDVQAAMDRYGIPGFPSVVFGGEILVSGGSFDQSVVDLYRGPVTEIAEKRVPMKVDFIESYLSENDTQYKATLDVSSLSNIEDRDQVIRIALTEDAIMEEWQSLDILDDVQRAFGEKQIDLSEKSDRIRFTLDIPAEMETNNGHVVVWLQSTRTNEIHNAAIYSLAEELTDVQEIELSEQEINLFPNPATNKLTVELPVNIKHISLHNTLGQQLRQIINRDQLTLSIDIADLVTGSYYLRTMDTEGQTKLHYFQKN